MVLILAMPAGCSAKESAVDPQLQEQCKKIPNPGPRDGPFLPLMLVYSEGVD